MTKYDIWSNCMDKDIVNVLSEYYGSGESKRTVSYDKCYARDGHKNASTFKHPEIKNVIFNEPATIVVWSDNTKTVVKCQEGDVYDPEKGLAMAISKKYFGNKGNYCEVFKKWVPEEKVEDVIPSATDFTFTMEIPKLDAKELVESIRKLGRKNRLNVEGEK